MNKSFEIIEKIAVHMTDNCFGTVVFPKRLEKLESEFAELMQSLSCWDFNTKLDDDGTMKSLVVQFPDSPTLLRAKDELGDVMLILVHISNALGFTASDVLHGAAMKMLKRMKDPHYNPKT